ILQDLEHRMIRRRLPFDPTNREIPPHDGQLQSRLLCPQQYLTSASKLTELSEYKTNRFHDVLVRIKHDTAAFVPAIAWRQGEAKFAPSSFRVAGCKPS